MEVWRISSSSKRLTLKTSASLTEPQSQWSIYLHYLLVDNLSTIAKCLTCPLSQPNSFIKTNILLYKFSCPLMVKLILAIMRTILLGLSHCLKNLLLFQVCQKDCKVIPINVFPLVETRLIYACTQCGPVIFLASMFYVSSG